MTNVEKKISLRTTNMTTLLAEARLLELIDIIWNRIFFLGKYDFPSSPSSPMHRVEGAPQESEDIRVLCQALLIKLSKKVKVIKSEVHKTIFQEAADTF